MRPGKQYSADPNYFEQLGVRWLRRMSRDEENRLHHLNPSELDQIRKIERWAVGWACLAGAISGGILGASEMVVRNLLVEDMDSANWQEQLPYWSVYLAVALVVSGIEILFLYWNTLRAVARNSVIAGVAISGAELEEAMARGLSRAALDMPNPREPLYGIDPYARIPRLKLLAYTVVYRVKVGVTSFLIRVLFRRIFARAALRFFIPFLAIPVFAVWNGLITWWVLREARIRIMGPVAVRDLCKHLGSMRNDLTPAARELLMKTLAEAIVRSGDAHPNFIILLHELFQLLETDPDHVQQPDWNVTRPKLEQLSEREKDAVARTLVLAALLDGRVSKGESRFLEEAHKIAGQPFERKKLLERYHEFVQGRGFAPENARQEDGASNQQDGETDDRQSAGM
jgi:hypothetical protein